MIKESLCLRGIAKIIKIIRNYLKVKMNLIKYFAIISNWWNVKCNSRKHQYSYNWNIAKLSKVYRIWKASLFEFNYTIADFSVFWTYLLSKILREILPLTFYFLMKKACQDLCHKKHRFPKISFSDPGTRSESCESNRFAAFKKFLQKLNEWCSSYLLPYWFLSPDEFKYPMHHQKAFLHSTPDKIAKHGFIFKFLNSADLPYLDCNFAYAW